MEDLAKIQLSCPGLTSLGVCIGLLRDYPLQFTQCKHRQGHGRDCDACVNPWLSISSLSLNIFTTSLFPPAMIAFLCLKFPNLTELSINYNMKVLEQRNVLNNNANLSSWQSLLDPTKGHWPLLTTFSLKHPFADLIMDALREFTSVNGLGASLLTTLRIETVNPFGNKYTMGPLAAFPFLRSLVINDKWSDCRITVPEYLVLQILPMTHLTHPLRELDLTDVKSADLLTISKMCPHLTRVTLSSNRWDLEKDHLAQYPEKAMPDAVDQLTIVQKFKQTPNWSKDRILWVPLPFSSRLKRITMRIWKPRWNVTYYAQTPACVAQGRDASSIAIVDEPLGFTGSYLSSEKTDEMQVISDPHAAFDTNWTRTEETRRKLHKKYAIVILSPCAPDVLEIQILRSISY